MSVQLREQLPEEWTVAEPEPLAIAVVGAGYWGPNLVRNALQSPATRVLDILEAASRSLEFHGSVVPLRGER